MIDISNQMARAGLLPETHSDEEFVEQQGGGYYQSPPQQYTQQPQQPQRVQNHYRPPEAFTSEAQTRLNKASYYQILLSGFLFDNPEDPLAFEVDEEIKKFVASRLEALLGMKNKEPVAVNNGGSFSEKEVMVLKMVASTVLEENLKKMSEQGRTKPIKIEGPPARPTLRRWVTPNPAALNQNQNFVSPEQSRKINTPPQKEIIMGQNEVPLAPPQQQLQPQRPQPMQMIQSPPHKKGEDPAPPPAGTVLQEGNKTYEITWRKIHPSLVNDDIWTTNNQQGVFQIYKKDITPVKKSIHSAKWGYPAQMAQMVTMKSVESVNLLGRYKPNIR